MKNYRDMAEKTLDILAELEPHMMEDMYKALRKQHVYRDVLTYLADDGAKASDESSKEDMQLADRIAEAIVYKGDYNNELGYWDNILRLQYKLMAA